MAATNNLVDEALLRLSRNDTTLTTLGLCGNEVGNEEAGRLAEALATNSTLTIFDLSVNEVGDEGAGRLAEALTINSTLTTLDLSFNQVGKEGAGRLAQALVINSTLTTLHLSDNKVGDSRRLVDAHLKRNKHNLKKKSESLSWLLLPLISLALFRWASAR